jgi:hypothetical protein
MTPALIPPPTSAGAAQNVSSAASVSDAADNRGGASDYGDFAQYLADPKPGQPSGAQASSAGRTASDPAATGFSGIASDDTGGDSPKSASGAPDARSAALAVRAYQDLSADPYPGRLGVDAPALGGRWTAAGVGGSALSSLIQGGQGSRVAPASARPAPTGKGKPSAVSPNESSAEAQTAPGVFPQAPALACGTAGMASGAALAPSSASAGPPLAAAPVASDDSVAEGKDGLASKASEALKPAATRPGERQRNDGSGIGASPSADGAWRSFAPFSAGSAELATSAGSPFAQGIAQGRPQAGSRAARAVAQGSIQGGTFTDSAALNSALSLTAATPEGTGALSGSAKSAGSASSEAATAGVSSLSRAGRSATPSNLQRDPAEAADPAVVDANGETQDLSAAEGESSESLAPQIGRPLQAMEAMAAYPNAQALGGAGARGSENIAVSGQSSAQASKEGFSDPDKKILNIDKKVDVKADTELGTTAAKLASVMPSHSTARSFAPLGAAVLANLTTGGTALSPNASGSGADALKATAREAVETVMRIADAQAGQSDAQAHVVNLGFKIGGENLSVRVELHGNEVHTQFSTDSSELRAALSGEWQGSTPGDGSRDLKFNDPVFTAGSESSGSTFEGGGTSYARQDDPSARSPSGWTSRSLDEGASDSAESVSVAETLSLSATAHLRAFA